MIFNHKKSHLVRIFTEMSTWDKPAELAELQLGYHRQGSDGLGSDLETFQKNHTSVATIPVDDFFNPIPPPSLKKLSKGLIFA